MEEIKPVFQDLGNTYMLKKYLRAMIQNGNVAFNQ